MQGHSRPGREKRRKAVVVGPQEMRGSMLEAGVKRRAMARSCRAFWAIASFILRAAGRLLDGFKQE